MKIQSISFALLGAALAPVVRCDAQSVSVTVANGTLVGVEDSKSDVQKFLGIPYAQPPIGDLRLRQARPLNSSFGTLQANAFGHSCYGAGSQPNASDDCLTLNIWRPPGKGAEAKELLPVLVWLYRGGLAAGYTSDPLFEGTNMVSISTEIQKPVILVSINYRLGSLGFLNGKQMAELGLLNIGMLDQRLALHWIQENIAAFGGDPGKVTLFGESVSAEEQLDCIRALPIDVFRASIGPKTGQSIDGDFTRTSIQFALPAGQYLKVPTVVGANTDEGTHSAPKGINTTDQLFEPLAQGYFRPHRLPNATVSKLLELYPTNPRLGCPYSTGDTRLTPGDLDKQACSIFGDLVMVAPARQLASTLAADGVAVYRYRFNQLPPPGGSPARGISTGVEQAYVFSNFFVGGTSSSSPPPSAWDRALAYEMTSAWVSFAHDLDPNPGGNSALPHWPEYGKEANSIVFNGQGSWVEKDTYRDEGIRYIIQNVLPDGAL
ncbi:alpha/beta-hydrolase [Apiospora saccharicola]|uniref:Alpha/beta-hydrolase n=1 Tax=Apiospora saccharicola TaxID=335842 RepID=A0ABR1TQL7_9PEZI